MEAAYVSALFGLGGALIGALASFSTTWMTQRFQFTAKLRESERATRVALFDSFIMEAVRLYGDALTHQNPDIGDLVKLYALAARMKLTASKATIEEAEAVMSQVTAAYLGPTLDLPQIYALAQEGKIDILARFGEACRADLKATGAF